MKAGLEDVIAGESGICYIDGEKGILAYRGYNIHELAPNSTFEETSYLLWFGRLPNARELKDITEKMTASRALAAPVIALLKSFPKDALPMEVLRTAISACSMHDPEAEDMSAEANQRKAIRLNAQCATIVAAFHNIRDGKEPIAPRAGLSHAGNFYYMLTGNDPSSTSVRALDVALILHADHELNASTFAGRVTAATLSDIYSAVTSAIGALKGPLHGGANEAVMRMLLEIGDMSKVDAYVHELFAQKKKIPGFGHRV
jgi:citrate synthase